MKKKDKLPDLYSEDNFSKIEFKQKNDVLSDEFEALNVQIVEKEIVEENSLTNVQRMNEMRKIIAKVIESPEGITINIQQIAVEGYSFDICA